MTGGARRTGIFGGTFDPIHLAHLEVADEVRRALDLDRMLLVVANQPWQKEGLREVTLAEDRFAVVAAAAADWPGLEASRLELDRGGPSYTVDTVRRILADDPDAELTLVVGSDVVDDLSNWHDAASLRPLVTLAVVRRPGTPEATPPPGWRSVTVDAHPRDVSSTGLRTRLEQGLPLDGLVPEAAIRCIRQRGLYATGR